MTSQFTGIDNTTEFYTHHYLEAVLAGDLKSEVYAAWSEEFGDDKKPHERLRALAAEYFKLGADLDESGDPERRRALHRKFVDAFLFALGYEPTDRARMLESGELATVAEVRRADGAPVLWALQAIDEVSGESEDPLNITSLSGQRLEELIGQEIFTLDEPPRFLLLFGESQILLLDRSKWREKRLLRFDLDEILGRKETETLKVTAALLERRRIWSDDGQSLLDTLDESSHKHAFAVSEDLKYALRESIELLGNEAIRYLREVRHEKVFGRKLADDLSRECLRYMYRVLFLFYIEARPELGYAPMGNDAYLKGYSLESLRELELVELGSEESLNGFYLHESLELLFGLIHDGAKPANQPDMHRGFDEDDPVHGLFTLAPLKTHLFDPKATPILSGVKLRNSVVQRIIELMSLSREGKKGRSSRKKRRGRISYAQLGINQLGAVYEALLSYRGFFAEEDLYEVKRKKDDYDELKTAYFVGKEALGTYDDKEIVKDPETGALVMHPKGAFIYRLAGRDREKSASYYTPEVLTRCLVKYALKELLSGDATSAPTADEILDLTVCEPAMGSAAFLNEAVNQLADAYLQKKQEELGREILHEDYLFEKQKVKMLIADRNVFGVDLNPIAVELAEVSLWLNTIHAGGFVPWFGMELRCGNSLIGARRERILIDEDGKAHAIPLHAEGEGEVPRRGGGDATSSAMSSPKRSPNSIYHFLLGHPSMADYNDYVIRGKGGKNPIEGLAEDAYEHFKSWRKDFSAPLDDHEYDSMVDLSDAVDRLWTRHVESLRDIRRRTTDPIDVWPHTGQDEHQPTTTGYKDEVLRNELYSKDVKASSPYRRLKLVMDYWCALWFWPNEHYELIPDRDEYLWDLSLILEVNIYQAPGDRDGDQTLLFPATVPEEKSRELVNELGFLDLDYLIARGGDTAERLEIVQKLAERHRFLHWELEFADIFHDKGGFDLILGNPPWLKVEWDEGGVLGDHDPFFVIKKLSAAKTRKLREETIERLDLRSQFLAAYEEATGTQNFLNADVNYPQLKGIQTNLYKCFIPTGWRVGNDRAVVGYLHPEGIYDDPKGGRFREEVYPRLRYHFQFHNERGLFAEVHHATMFSINVYRAARRARLDFDHIANLFLPQTVDASITHHGHGVVPGIKDDDNNWNIKGHLARVIDVTEEELGLFARLYDDEGTPSRQARLPALHSTQLVAVLQKFADQPHSLGDLKGEYFSLEMWHETNAQKDGTIRRETRFPESPSEWILSGPHFFVGNPFNKTPRAICDHNQAYDPLDLVDLPDDYLPRTNYVPDCSPEEYLRRTPKVPWGVEKPVTEFYRYVNREMIGPSAERTLISTVLPKSVGHINTCLAYAFKNTEQLVDFFSMTISTVLDFRVKSTGMGHANTSLVGQLPILKPTSPYRRQLHVRALMLTALTTHYADLWQSCYDPTFNDDRWAKEDPRLDNDHFRNLTKDWTRHVALRTDYARRQALVEIDVLAAMALGLTLEELQTIYRVQFPVMRMYEDDTWYDQKGRIVFTNSRGLVGVGLPRRKSANWPDGPYWEDVQHMTEGTVTQTVIDDTLPLDAGKLPALHAGEREKTILYHAPFTRCDREADYATVWRHFEERFGDDGSNDTKRERQRLTGLMPQISLPKTDDSKAAEKKKMISVDREIPQANSVERLTELLEAIAAGITSYDALARSLNISTRTVHYYVKLGEWLDFAEVPRRGEAALTDEGRGYVDSPEKQSGRYREALYARDLCREILAAKGPDDDIEAAALRVIQATTSLADATARRRAAALASLIDAAGLSQPPDAEEIRGLSVDILKPDSLFVRKLPGMGVETVGDVLDYDIDRLREVRGMGRKNVEAFREMVGRAQRLVQPEQPDTIEAIRDVEILDPPSLIAARLKSLNIKTIDDVLKLDIENIRSVRGVGTKAAAAFRDLYRRAERYVGMMPADREDAKADFESFGEIPVERILPVVSNRIGNSLRAAEVTTVAELAKMAADGLLTRLPGMGLKSADEVGEVLAALSEKGQDYVLYGEEGRPTSAEMLIAAALQRCEAREQIVLKRRYFESRTLEEVGEELGLTRERIRQIEAHEIERLESLFKEVAWELEADLLRVITESAGLIHGSLAARHTGVESIGHNRFFLRLAGLENIAIWRGEFLVAVTPSERDETIDGFKRTLMELEDVRAELDDAFDCAREVGLELDRQGIARLLAVAFDIEVREEAFTLPWRSMSDVMAGVLIEIGRPASTEEILETYEKKRVEFALDLPELNTRNLRAHLEHSQEVYGYGHGVYVHEDNLPLSQAAFETAVQWAVDFLEGRKDQVSVETIIDEMRFDRLAPPGMTPHLLKSALNRRGDVISFRNTLLVAYADTWVDSGTMMVDRISEALRAYDEPISARRISRDLARFSYSKHSVYETLLRKPFGLPMGHGKFLHRDATGLSDEELDGLISELDEIIPADGTPLAAPAALAELTVPGVDKLQHHDEGARILWALARGYTDLVAGGGLLLARRSDETSSSLFQAAVVNAFTELGVAYPRDVNAWLKSELGFAGDSGHVNSVIYKFTQNGRLHRLPNSAYFLAGEDREALFERWIERPELIRDAAAMDEIAEQPAEILDAMAEFFTEWDPREALVARL